MHMQGLLRRKEIKEQNPSPSPGLILTVTTRTARLQTAFSG